MGVQATSSFLADAGSSRSRTENTMLDAIQTYLKRQKQACLADIALAVNAPAEAVQPMLELLESKGRIKRNRIDSKACGGCTRCDPAALTIWHWKVDRQDGHRP